MHPDPTTPVCGTYAFRYNIHTSVLLISMRANSIFLRKNLDGKEVRYDERVFGSDENDQGSGVASEGLF